MAVLPDNLKQAMLKDRRLRSAVHEVVASIEDAKRPDYEAVARVLKHFGMEAEPE